MKIPAMLFCLLVLGGCVGKDGGSEVEAAATSGRAHQGDDGREGRPARQQCENTSIGGQPKSFCY